MESFVHNHAEQIIGIICGFDRLVFGGFLRSLSYVEGMMKYMAIAGVMLKDFVSHALSMTKRIKEASLRSAEEAGRPIIYLPSSQTDKEGMAHEIAGRDGISSGLICVLSCVEPCRSYEIFRNSETRQLELQPIRIKLSRYPSVSIVKTVIIGDLVLNKLSDCLPLAFLLADPAG